VDLQIMPTAQGIIYGIDSVYSIFLFTVLSARALYHCEALCKKEDVQRFLSGLTSKRPEVGHLVKCFHTAKSSSNESKV
jgi:hypothetical protein